MSPAARPADAPEILDLFRAHLEIVEIIANQVSRKVGPALDRDDLVSAGREGLLDAARNFDPANGVTFNTFASYRVRGAMLDHARKMSGLPRRAYYRLLALEAASSVSEGDIEVATAKPVRRADEAEAEAALDNQIATTALATAMGILSAGARGASADQAEVTDPDPEQAFAQAEILAHVKSALAALESHESHIVRRYYFEGESFGEISRALDLDKAWVFRLHARALKRLSKRLQGVV